MNQSAADSRQAVAGMPTWEGPVRRFSLMWQAGQTPDPSAFLSGDDSLSHGERVAILLIDQAERWRRGQRVPVESYLRHHHLEGDDEAILDLICNEQALRRERGEAFTEDEYYARFPRQAEALRRQLSVERGLAGETRASLGGESTPREVVRLPAEIGKYRILACLGEGGQGTVYRAVHPTLDREVVVKLCREPAGAELDPAVRETLLGEGRLLAEVDHPNLARVYDLDFHERRPFVVLEHIHGRNLEQIARQETPAPRRAAALLAPVARALAAVHRRGLVHRDVKPANILVGEDGRPRLIDFGLALFRDAWAEEAGGPRICGTPSFMAPEQARGDVAGVGPRSDIFALGGVLYSLLTGRSPFGDSSLTQTLERARRADWPRDDPRFLRAPRRLQAICKRAMAAESKDRYARAEDLADDLDAFARSRLPGKAVLAALAGLVLVLAVVLALVGDRKTERPTTSDIPRSVSPQPRPDRAGLSVRVWRQGRYRALTAVVPARTGEELEVQAEVPAGVHAGLFAYSDGGLRRVAAWAPASSPRRVRYPESPNQAVPLTGEPGTELLLLVCGRSARAIDEQEVRALSGVGSKLPTLPGPAVLRVERDRVVVEQAGRDIGPPRGRPDPAGEVRRRLEVLRQRLQPHCDGLAGVAFGHQASEDD
jgi:serine/threonine protein kinase